jgi:hypothetical protein
VDSDIYGRLVAQIYSGKKYINLEMLKAGHAWWYEKYAPDEKTFKESEKKASGMIHPQLIKFGEKGKLATANRNFRGKLNFLVRIISGMCM